jgi:LysM repeat protein
MENVEMKLRQPLTIVFSLLLAVLFMLPWNSATVLAEGETYVVQPGDTLWQLAQRFGTSIDELVNLNDIRNPDLIFVGQVLALPAPAGETAAPAQVTGGPLSLSWSLVDWQPADPDYVATLALQVRGGTPPYTYYHDGIAQPEATFEFAWLRCHPKPGSVGVSDAAGQNVELDYWLKAPYCPVGVEILRPKEEEELTHSPRHFNITWRHTVSPPPPAYGIEIEVWEQGSYRPWKSYVHRRGEKELFFVPDEFPGDLGGRVRMWGIYGQQDAYAKTPWRTFDFRVTY